MFQIPDVWLSQTKNYLEKSGHFVIMHSNSKKEMASSLSKSASSNTFRIKCSISRSLNSLVPVKRLNTCRTSDSFKASSSSKSKKKQKSINKNYHLLIAKKNPVIDALKTANLNFLNRTYRKYGKYTRTSKLSAIFD